MMFYLGTNRPHWLALVDVPLFVSRTTLHQRRSLPRARCHWALDSGGFSELSAHGCWTVSPQTYAAEVRRFRDEIGQLDFAAAQDWMCEPQILRMTGLTVTEHQKRTIENYVTLCDLAPDLPWLPVLQGWDPEDYRRHLALYDRYGVQLTHCGVGTLCRRQGTTEALIVLKALSWEGLSLHGFGFKITGLRKAAHCLSSADSMAWSYNARHNPAMLGHTHRNCANCLDYALAWRSRLLGGPVPLLEGVA